MNSTRTRKPWTQETRQGWTLARAWRQHNNGNTEIILAEYLTFTALCRESGCACNTIAGKSIAARAAEVKSLIAETAAPTGLPRPRTPGSPASTMRRGRTPRCGARISIVSSADFATGNLYALDWLLARARPPAEQAAAFARSALFIQGRAWIGTRCLDIAKIATDLDAPSKVESCQ